MATLADAYVRLRPDTTRVGPELREQTAGPAGAAGQEAGSHFGRRMAVAIGAAVVAGTVLVTRRLLSEMRQAIDSASDLNETVSKVGVIFGDGAAAVNQFAESAATAMGQSKQQALDGAATFALYGKTAGLSAKALVPFSTNLVKLASDMASFSNTTPEEAIQAIGAAFRGEADPIEKYGILLNETVLKNEALRLGLIKTTTAALTPQQRVLAVHSALLKQTGDAQGDFARTSAGVANQQRIAAAQVENLRARIGTALLPAMNAWLTMVNTKLIPALNDLWTKHGPAITKFLEDAAVKFGDFAERLSAVDWADLVRRGADAFKALGPAIAEVQKQGPLLNDTLQVGGTVMRFLADNADTLAKLLPYLAAGYVLVKTASAANNVVQSLSWPLELLRWNTQRKLVASNTALAAAVRAHTTATIASTVATTGETTAQNVGMLTRIRATAGLVAHAVAMGVVRVATIAWTAVQWALNVALTANPIGVIIVGIAALVAAIIYAYTQSETFRKIVQVVWQSTYFWIKLVVDFVVGTAWPALRGAWNSISALAVGLYNTWRSNLERVIGFIRGLPNMILSALGNFGTLLLDKGADLVRGLWNGIQGMGGWLRDRLISWAKSAIPGPIAKALGIASPSRLAAEMIGRPFGEGIAVGIQETTGQIAAAVTGSLLPTGAGRPPSGLATAGAGSPAGGGPDVLELTLDLGHGIQQVVTINLRERDRNLKRRALAGAGAQI